MRLNTFKDQLKKLKPKEEIPTQQPKRKRVSRPANHLYKHAVILRSGVALTPVDRVAARVVSKAPWWAHLESKTNTTMNEKDTKDNLVKSNYGSGLVVRDKTDHEMTQQISSSFVKQTEKTISETESLTQRALEARAAMDVLSESWKKAWFDFQATSDERLKEFRMTRIAVDTEMRLLLASLKEVRMFFLDDDYQKEIARLKEFADVCERLQQLKSSGFLDTVAETILKLAVGNRS